LLWNSGIANSNSSYDEIRNVIITQVFQNTVDCNDPNNFVCGPNIDLINEKSNVGFLGFPDPLELTPSSTSAIDASLRNYVALEQIEGYTNGGISNYKIVIFDQLVDFTHPDLTNSISKAVLLPNDYTSTIDEYSQSQLSTINPFTHTDFQDYILSSREPDFFGHGTEVAGVIHQIAPNTEIISVAIRRDIVFAQLKPTLTRFLDWLEDYSDEEFIINISSGWSEALTANDMDSDSSGTIANRMMNLLYDESSGYRRNLFFVCSAGNTNSQDIMFPANLSNDWEDRTWTEVVPGKVDKNLNPAKANGFVSVGSIYDEGVNLGKRDYDFANDFDSNGDLKLMAPGFDIDTTFPTFNPYPDNAQHGGITDYISFTGTSASAPVVSALTALLCSETSSVISAVDLEVKLTQNAIYDSNVNLPLHNKLMNYGHGMVNFIVTIAEYELSLVNLDSDGDTLLDVDELYNYHIDPLKTDTDNDELPDNWELDHGTDPAIYNGLDPDLDDLTNAEELAIGTDPFNDDSDNDFLTDGDEVNEYGTNPTMYDTDTDGMPDYWEVNMDTNPVANDALSDYDFDDLSNIEEFNHNTDPQNPDTDFDSLPDGWEVQYGLSPTNSFGDDGETGDSDGDSLLNMDEYSFGTDPTIADCDGDGLDDHFEYIYGTDPWDTDTDNDSIDDYEETHLGADGFLSDPTSSDGDQDGISDVEEVTIGADGFITDPLNSDTDFDLIDDFDEIYIHGTNPTNHDTDNDLLSDYQELFVEFTDPLDADTDKDGYSDGYECDLTRNWDPLNPFDPNSNPENIQIIQQSNASQLYISWDEMCGISLYKITYQRIGDTEWITVYSNISSVLLVDLIEGSEYIIFVYAQSEYNQQWSSSIYEYGWTRQPQPDVTILTLSNYVDITIEYFLSEYATELELWWMVEGGQWVLYGVYYSDGSVTITDLDLNTWYYFKTRQRINDSSWTDSYWSVFSFETSIQTSQEPTPLSVRYFEGEGNGAVRITFTWVKPTNWMEGWYYQIWRKPIGGSYTLIKTTTSTAFNHYPPNPTALYTYRITCFNNYGIYGPYSYWTGKASSGGGGGGPM